MNIRASTVGRPNRPQTLGRPAKSLTGHENLTPTGALNGSQTPGLTGTPHIQPKYGPDMVATERVCHVGLMMGSDRKTL